MRSSQETLTRWDTVPYQQIRGASFEDGVINVEFGDGTHARISADLLVSKAMAPSWTEMRVEEYHLVVPSGEGDLEIPWDVIRVHTDPEFDAHWASFAR
jgi:hypothetical protein